MNVLTRLCGMALSWGAVGLVYTTSGLRGPEGAHHLTPWAIDLLLPFTPQAIWPYLSFFLLVPLGYLAAQPARFYWMCLAVFYSALGAGVVFALYPTTMHFPPVHQEGLSADLLRLLMAHDALVNCLPSLHVALSLIAAMALDGRWPRGRVLIWLWAGVICLSILVLRRHQCVDLVTGAALAALAGAAAQRFPLFKVSQKGAM